MNSGNFNSKKYLIILIAVCFLFMILTLKLINKAQEGMQSDDYQGYYPGEGPAASDISVKKSYTYIDEDSEAEEDDGEDEYDEEENISENNKSGHIDFMPKDSYSNNYDIIEIPAPKGTIEEDIIINYNKTNDNNLTKDEQALKYISNGKQYKENNDLSASLNEYQKASEIAENKEIKAMGYDGIAEIYASQRRFGTALSFASKANNLAPSNSREMLIARINYNAGMTQDAVSRTTNLMKKGF